MRYIGRRFEGLTRATIAPALGMMHPKSLRCATKTVVVRLRDTGELITVVARWEIDARYVFKLQCKQTSEDCLLPFSPYSREPSEHYLPGLPMYYVVFCKSYMKSERTSRLGFTNLVSDAKTRVRVRHIACDRPRHRITVNY
jgi:hypothetical protein